MWRRNRARRSSTARAARRSASRFSSRSVRRAARASSTAAEEARRRRACVSWRHLCHARAVNARRTLARTTARRRATAASRAAARRLFSSPVSYHSRESWTRLRSRFAMCASRRRRTSSARSSSAVIRRCERFRESVTTHCWRKSSSLVGKNRPRVSVHISRSGAFGRESGRKILERTTSRTSSPGTRAEPEERARFQASAAARSFAANAAGGSDPPRIRPDASPGTATREGRSAHFQTRRHPRRPIGPTVS